MEMNEDMAGVVHLPRQPRPAVRRRAPAPSRTFGRGLWWPQPRPSTGLCTILDTSLLPPFAPLGVYTRGLACLLAHVPARADGYLSRRCRRTLHASNLFYSLEVFGTSLCRPGLLTRLGTAPKGGYLPIPCLSLVRPPICPADWAAINMFVDLCKARAAAGLTLPGVDAVRRDIRGALLRTLEQPGRDATPATYSGTLPGKQSS